MLPIKLVCKKNLIRKDGTSIIFIQYCQSIDRRTLLNSGVAVPPKYWNLKKLRVNSDLPECYGEANALNETLQKSTRIAEDILNFAKEKKIADPLTFLKSNFKPGFDISQLTTKLKEVEKPKTNLELYFQIDDYIRYKTPKVSFHMVRIFQNMKTTLKAFESFRGSKITFDSFDFNFYEEFVDYMTYEHIHRGRKTVIKGLRISSVGRTIKQLRIFLRNRMRKKIIPFIDLEDFKIPDEESDAIYLTWEEIIKIYKVNLSDYPHLVKYRDLFVFGCLTGLRYSDFSTIKPEDLRGKMLYKKQNKSDHWVVVPLRDEAYSIFKILWANGTPIVFNGPFNQHIKSIGKLAGIIDTIKFSYKKGNKDIVTVKPKYGWITTHTCRRSFCTNEFLAGTPAELIMKISGHKNLRDFYKYIRITPEEAGLRIKEIWENRGAMKLL